jgi:hypothetical protein
METTLLTPLGTNEFDISSTMVDCPLIDFDWSFLPDIPPIDPLPQPLSTDELAVNFASYMLSNASLPYKLCKKLTMLDGKQVDVELNIIIKESPDVFLATLPPSPLPSIESSIGDSMGQSGDTSSHNNEEDEGCRCGNALQCH